MPCMHLLVMLLPTRVRLRTSVYTLPVTFNLAAHVTYITSKMSSMLTGLICVSCITETDVTVVCRGSRPVHSTSILPVYGSCGVTQLGRVQKFANFCARVITGRRRYVSCALGPPSPGEMKSSPWWCYSCGQLCTGSTKPGGDEVVSVVVLQLRSAVYRVHQARGR